MSVVEPLENLLKGIAGNTFHQGPASDRRIERMNRSQACLDVGYSRL